MHEVDVLLPIRSPRVDWLQATLRSIEDQQDVDCRLVAVVHPDNADIRHVIGACSRPTVTAWAPAIGNLADALNAGLAACSADYVARIDADDLAEPARLNLQLNTLRQDSDCVALGSQAHIIDDSGQIVGMRELPTEPSDVLAQMRWRSAVMHPSVMFRRKAVMSVGGYRSAAENVEDYELWLRMLCLGTIRNVNEPLLRYRVHANQVTQTRSITHAASATVLAARLELAQQRGESRSAARLRHLAWDAKQVIRRWSR